MIHDLLIAAAISILTGLALGFAVGLPDTIRKMRKINAEANAVIAGIMADRERLREEIRKHDV